MIFNPSSFLSYYWERPFSFTGYDADNMQDDVTNSANRATGLSLPRCSPPWPSLAELFRPWWCPSAWDTGRICVRKLWQVATRALQCTHKRHVTTSKIEIHATVNSWLYPSVSKTSSLIFEVRKDLFSVELVENILHKTHESNIY